MSITPAPMPWAVFVHQNFQQTGGSNNIINQFATFREALTLAKKLYRYIHESTDNPNERSLWIEHTHTPKCHQSVHHIIPLGAMIQWQHFGDFQEYRAPNIHHLTAIFSTSFADLNVEHAYSINHHDYEHKIQLKTAYTRIITDHDECISRHQYTQYTLHSFYQNNKKFTQKTIMNPQDIHTNINQELQRHILSFPNISHHERIHATHALTHALSAPEHQHPIIEPTIIIR